MSSYMQCSQFLVVSCYAVLWHVISFMSLCTIYEQYSCTVCRVKINAMHIPPALVCSLRGRARNILSQLQMILILGMPFQNSWATWGLLSSYFLSMIDTSMLLRQNLLLCKRHWQLYQDAYQVKMRHTYIHLPTFIFLEYFILKSPLPLWLDLSISHWVGVRLTWPNTCTVQYSTCTRLTIHFFRLRGWADRFEV